MPSQPFNPQVGDIIVRQYLRHNQYLRIETMQPDGIGYLPIADGEKELLQWAKLGGRMPFELACSNPIPKRDCPSAILRVMHFNTPSKTRISKRQRIPKSIREAWGTATPDFETSVIRTHVRFLCSLRSDRQSWDDAAITRQMEAVLKTPFGQPFPTNAH